MNFGLNDDQEMLRSSLARFLDAESGIARVRAATASGGFDRQLWRGLAELGILAMRIPEETGGLGMGTLDAALVLEEAGRTLASAPLAEALVANRMLGQIGNDEGLLAEAISGNKVITIAFRDIAANPTQWVAGGTIADVILARRANEVVLIEPSRTSSEPTLADNGLAEIDFAAYNATTLACGPHAVAAFDAALEEWKLLTAAALSGIARQAINLAAEYACERKAFGVPIGSFQAISHPLANLITEVDGGKLLVWKAIHDLAHGKLEASANVSLSLWWNAKTAAGACIQSLRTFGGYGLTTEYDIHLYNLRAKALPLAFGDPDDLLEEAGRRLYGNEVVAPLAVGPVSIDFDLGEEAEQLALDLDHFFDETLTPELRAHAHYSWDGHHPEVHKKLADAELLFPAWPREKGGRGASPYARHAAAAVWEKHGWTSHAAGTTQMVAVMIEKFGSEELKREVLEPIIRGEAICSLGYSEPGSGSDVFAAQTRATPDGNGWRIDGTKMFTSGANLSDYVLMLTRTNTQVAKHKGLTMFIVPMKADGVSVQPVYTFQDERTNITFYDGVRIPDSYRLGDVDGGTRTMSAALELEHGGGFYKSQVTLVEAAENLCREISARKTERLIDNPLAQMRLARAKAHATISELLGLRALWSAENKLNLPAVGPMTKMFSSDRFLEDASDLLNLTAPMSLSKREGPAFAINLAYRHAHGTTIYGGTSEVHRSMIAERALGLPRTR